MLVLGLVCAETEVSPWPPPAMSPANSVVWQSCCVAPMGSQLHPCSQTFSAGSASTAQDLVSSLTPAEVAALPTVPQGLQIILLPSNLTLAGLPAAMAIPASFTVPQQLQNYSYILTSASDALPALPAGFRSSSPSPGEPLRSGFCLHACSKCYTTLPGLPSCALIWASSWCSILCTLCAVQVSCA